MRKALSLKQHIKASVETRKFLSEFCLEILIIEFNIELLSSVCFKRFSGVKIYKICDELLPLTHYLLLNTLFLTVFPFSGSLHLFQLFTISDMTLTNVSF